MRLLYLLTVVPALALAQDPAPPAQDPEGLAHWRGHLQADSGPLSTLFPEVEVKLNVEAACDLYRVIEEILVDGKRVERADVLPRLLELRKGWSRDGASTDQAILETAAAFGRAWAAINDLACMTSEEAPREVTGLLERAKVKFGAHDEGKPRPPFAYHPPRASLHELTDGSRIVVYAFFSISKGSSFPNEPSTHLSYWVSAYHVADGKPYPVPHRSRDFKPGHVQPKDPASLPRSMSVSDR